jgi:hypothetical protein
MRFSIPLFVGFALLACASESPVPSQPSTDGAAPPPAPGDGGGSSSSSSSGTTPACSPTSTVAIEPMLINLVVLFDTTGSICAPIDDTGGVGARDCSSALSKWRQVLRGFSTFASAPAPLPVAVSLIPWGDSNAVCTVAAKSATATSVRLPDTTNSLVGALNRINPQGGSPLGSATEAGVKFSTELARTAPADTRTVHVLMTDSPTTCRDAARAPAAAQTGLAAGVKTFVIGVGAAATSNVVDPIANAGGTGTAIPLTTDAAVELPAALTSILQKSSSCERTLAKNPDGTPAVASQVSLVLTKSGTKATLPYSQDCSEPQGWKYVPNAQSPVRIELCPSACTEARAEPQTALSAELGCASR